jgi:hypothetical protein
MTLQLLQLMFTGAAASVLVSLPVGLLLVGGHAVMHEYNCPAEDGAVDEEVGSIVWRRGVPPCDAPTATAVSKTTRKATRLCRAKPVPFINSATCLGC